MKSQWCNYRRDIGFHAAKEELLGSGKIMFCEPGSTTPKYVFTDEELEVPFPLPVIADSFGEFPEMHFNGFYSITVSDRQGNLLTLCTPHDPASAMRDT